MMPLKIMKLKKCSIQFLVIENKNLSLLSKIEHFLFSH